MLLRTFHLCLCALHSQFRSQSKSMRMYFFLLGWHVRTTLNRVTVLIKSLLMPLFLRKGCFPGDFQEGTQPIRAFGKRPIKVGKRPIQEGKRPINANGPFSGTLPWWKRPLLKRPIKRSTNLLKFRKVPEGNSVL